MSRGKQDLLAKAWELACRVACKPSPPGTVSIPMDTAVDLLTSEFERFLDGFKTLPNESEFLAAVTTWARELALDHVAKYREDTNNLEHFRHGGAHERNLDLRKLQPPPESMDAAEWAALDEALRPCGYAVLKPFKELSQEDKDDAYSKSLTELYRPRQRDGLSPLDQIRVFEEVFPFFSRIVHFTAKRQLRKLKPSAELEEVDEETLQFQPGLTFARIQFECAEALTRPEWTLVTRKFVAGETDTELIDNDHLLEELGIGLHLSAISRRRHLKERMEAALEKLAHSLKETGHLG